MVPPVLLELPQELRGERIRIRAYQPGDGLPMFEAIDTSREHLRPWLPWVDKHVTPEDSEAQVRRFDAHWRLREDLGVGIWDLDGRRFLGGSGLHRIDWRRRSFEVGYWLRADAEGHGFVTEAVRLLCELAFGTLAANRVFIRCAAQNERSAAIPRRLGFEHEGTLRNEGMHPSGELYDMLVYGMTPEAWERR